MSHFTLNHLIVTHIVWIIAVEDSHAVYMLCWLPGWYTHPIIQVFSTKSQLTPATYDDSGYGREIQKYKKHRLVH
jgi:hypothetical protein